MRGFAGCSTGEVAARAPELLIGNGACQTPKLGTTKVSSPSKESRFAIFNVTKSIQSFDATPPQSWKRSSQNDTYIDNGDANWHRVGGL